MLADPRSWWFVARASGLIGWAALAATMSLGLLLSSRVTHPELRPVWLRALHRHVSMLAVGTIGLHLVALAADSYIEFGPVELFVPLASPWKPVAVAFGIVALYYLALVQITSLAMHRLSRSTWRGVHATSYLAFLLAGIHFALAGSDARSLSVLIPAVAVASSTGLLIVFRLLRRGERQVPGHKRPPTGS